MVLARAASSQGLTGEESAFKFTHMVLTDLGHSISKFITGLTAMLRLSKDHAKVLVSCWPKTDYCHVGVYRASQNMATDFL
jgi:hypothetical protein